MRSDLATGYAVENQLKVYHAHRNLSQQNQFNGRLLAVPVAMLDVMLSTGKVPLSVIEHLAVAVINLLGAAFSDKCAIKDALSSFELACISMASTPVQILLAPIKFVFQVCIILIDPVKYQPYLTNPAFEGGVVVMYHHSYPAHLKANYFINLKEV
jgi:hypothetical protein